VAAAKELEALLDGEADGNDTFLEINGHSTSESETPWTVGTFLYMGWVFTSLLFSIWGG